MFERFTDRARRVVVLAQEDARQLNHNYVGTEHILLGVLGEDEGVGAAALKALGLSLDEVREQVAAVVGVGATAPTGHIPFTPRAKKVCELSLREALQLGHNHIGPEHILLGLIREGEGVAAQVLVKFGAELTRVRQQIIQILYDNRPSPPPMPIWCAYHSDGSAYAIFPTEVEALRHAVKNCMSQVMQITWGDIGEQLRGGMFRTVSEFANDFIETPEADKSA